MKRIMVLFLLFFSLSAFANPIPVTIIGGMPIIKNPNILFISEIVKYTVDTEDRVKIDATYFFKNLQNETINLTILLPNLHRASFVHIWKDGSLILSPTDDIQLGKVDGWDGIFINISFPSRKICNLTLKYEMKLYKTSHFFKDSYHCIYYASTATYWNNSINATFIIKVRDKLFSKGLKGFDREKRNGYVVATKTFEAWKEYENIFFEWEVLNYKHIVMVIVTVVFIILMLFAAFIRKMHNKV